MQHIVGSMNSEGETCVYIGKPKKRRGWLNENNFVSSFYLVTMGFRRKDGTFHSQKFIQPITDTFIPGGVKP